MNRNSVRNRPTPLAPRATARSDSAGVPMLAGSGGAAGGGGGGEPVSSAMPSRRSRGRLAVRDGGRSSATTIEGRSSVGGGPGPARTASIGAAPPPPPVPRAPRALLRSPSRRHGTARAQLVPRPARSGGRRDEAR